MLLKNKAPSLKPQNSCETISTVLCNTSANNIKSKNALIPKEEVCETPVSYLKNDALNKNDQDNNSGNNSKLNFIEFNDISSLHLKSGNDVMDANLLDSQINIKEFPSNENTSTEKINKSSNNESSNQIFNLKRKSEFHLEKLSNQDNKKVMKRKKKSGSPSIPSKSKINIKTPKSLDSGVYVECDSCHKIRYLEDVLNPSEIPSIWTCEMAKNKSLNCAMIQENYEDSVDYFINNNHTLGSIVWAKAPGFCWWPAIIDDDPDLHMFYWCFEQSDDVSHYHVTFLDDDVSRSWIKTKDIKVFRGKADMPSMKFAKSKKDYTKLLAKAVERAEECRTLSLQECLDKYSFAVRYTGRPNVWTSSKNSTKRRSKLQLKHTDSEDESHVKIEYKLTSSDKNEIKIKKIKTEKNYGDLSIDVAKIEAKNEVLIALNQQTKHDLIIKNTTKEKKKKTKNKTKKTIKKSDWNTKVLCINRESNKGVR